ncbi:MAG TPA: hypothetical protein EYP24_03000, partial [bacterium (Candidatus Stahlbacteria)]|nr:hypothetical protein [Candidatus Stahlbacteria bacterium]
MEGLEIKGPQAEDLLQFKLSLYLEGKDLEHALPLLKEIYNQNPEKIDEVIKGFRDLERAFPDNIDLKYGLGDLYLETGRVGLAVEEFQKVLTI